METGEPGQARIWVQRRGAQAGQLFADFAGRPVCDAGGTVAGVLLYAADVTAHARDQKRLEALAEDLAASEEQCRTLFETMPQGIVHYAADGSILGANQAACEILGMDLAAVTSWPVIRKGRRSARTARRSRPRTCRSAWRCGQARSWPTRWPASGTDGPVNCAGYG